ncbi:ABC transporter substrate-binding protein [Ancylothrix sp. C2]|uniref:ABC transporter substrate-binding protein n=1 Tax=Ancylothrix sp. D3o TaxID=2953691 RepID=UPI0021BB6F21|nr:ABC transporter substrate-binding protein [Ancylothrix sp. D3o]MCT7950957.1 ABC transporter substrate-binding protein [Ancylothrix sp. D3o]
MNLPHPYKPLKKIVKFLTLFSICCILAVSCGRQTTPQATTGQPGRITIGMTSKLRTIDPADAYEIASGTLLYNLGDRLYTYKTGTTEIIPQLATELPKINPDGLTYTIPLRKGVLFHDGTEFNAEAMAFSLNRLIENGGRPSSLFAGRVDSIKATGDYELTIKLKKPFAAFTSLLTFFGACPVSPKAYETGTGKFKPDTFVGTGPYKLTSYGTDNIKLEPFEKYWGEKPLNKGIDIQRLSNSSNLFTSFRTGAVDVAYQTLDLDQISNLEKQASSTGWQVFSQRSNGIYYLNLNLQSKPLDNLAVRQALAAVIDRPVLQNRVFRGQIEPLYSLIPVTMEDIYQPVFKEQNGDTNINKATEALKQAGYSPQNPLKLELWYRSNLTTDSLVASTLKADIERKLGGILQLQLNGVESATAYDNLAKGIYPLFILDWSPDFLDPDNYLQPFMECTKGTAEKGCEEGETKQAGSFYYNPRANELIDKQRKEQNPQTRKQIFQELQQIVAKDIPYIPLWQGKEYLFAQKQIQGITIEPTQRIPFWTMKK